MNFTRLSLSEVGAALQDVARDTQATFGALDAQQLNWKPEAARWSVAQCFQHLLTANALVLQAAEAALRNPPTSVWQRLPLLPRIFGQLMIRSQGPKMVGRYTAPPMAQPATSEIDTDVIQRFVDQQHGAADWLRAVDQRDADRVIMVSPFVRVVTYSVLDGCRLLVAHDRRHFEQARRVMLIDGFPAARISVH